MLAGSIREKHNLNGTEIPSINMESVFKIERIAVHNQIHAIPLNTNALFRNLELKGNMVTMSLVKVRKHCINGESK